jgi:hypothetical protein
MSNPAQITILAEDRRQARFVRSYLRKRLPDLPQSAIKDAPMADGKSAGSQWVLNRYAVEVKAHCARQAAKWLIVVIDADNNTVQDRIQHFDQRLREFPYKKLSKVHVETEQMAHLIPKWSIETWLLNLNGSVVNEDTQYKPQHSSWDEMIRLASQELHTWVRSEETPAQCTPSLQHGIRELRRLSPIK